MEIINGNGMELLFIMQRKLIAEYQIIEGLPLYPIDIHEKAGQKLIKGYVAKMVEELSEGFHELFEAYKDISNNRSASAKERVKNYNIEVADAIHFLLEILIYCGIDEDYLSGALSKDLMERGMEGIMVEGDPYTSLFKLAFYLNELHQTKQRSSTQFHIFNQQDNMENPEYAGGSKVNEKTLDIHAQFLWYITHALNTTIGYLKNKDWTVTESKVNEINFYGGLIESVIMVFQYLEFAGFNIKGLFTIYTIKNGINHERIKNGY